MTRVQPSALDAVVELHGAPGPAQLAWGTAKRTYRIERGRLVLAEPEPLRHDLRDESREPKWPPGSDYWPFKPISDVVVLGKAFAPKGRPVEQRRVSVRVGNVRKRVQVFGTRFVEWTSEGEPRLGAPEPFMEMPLVYTNAYGGLDRRVSVPPSRSFWDALRLTADHPGVYPRNQSGKGYLVIDAPIEGVELPNLEDPDHLLSTETLLVKDPARWYQQPLSWFLDWQFPAMFPRAHYAGAKPWHPVPASALLEEVRRGYLPESWRERMGDVGRGRPPAPAYFQEASLGMAFSDLGEGMPIEIEGMHPERERLELALPASPRLEIDVEGDRQPVEAKILHVVITPHEEKVEITWAGIRRDLPRAFFPGVHGHIPITFFVDGAAIPYVTPEPIYQKLKRAEAEGKLDVRPERRRPGEKGYVELAGELAPEELPRRERDQVAYDDAPRLGALDPVAGRALLREVDWELAGPVPFRFERFYSSSMAWRRSSLGLGWSHCLEQAVWEQDGWVLYRTSDGREIGIPISGARELAIGASAHHPVLGVTVLRSAGDAYEVRLASGARYGFTRIGAAVSSGPAKARLTRIWGIDGASLEVRYDTAGRLDRLLLGAGHYARFEHDERGRLTRLFVPTRDGRDAVVAARFEHDAIGQLREAADGLGRASSYRHQARVLVQHTARSGLARRFVHDGIGARARCIAEEWGEDACVRELLHQERVTGIADALGSSFSVRTNAHLQIDRVLDRFANETAREHDEISGLLSKQITKDGETSFLYDAFYHLADVTHSDGGSEGLDHDACGRMTRHTDADGHAARWSWDAIGRLRAAIDRTGASVVYDHDGEGALVGLLVPGEARITLERDPASRCVLEVRGPTGARRARHDALSRITEVLDELGASTRYRYDPCGRVAQEELSAGLVRAYESDAGGNVTSVRDGVIALAMERDGFGRLVHLDEGDGGPRLHRDAEGRVTMVEDEALDLWELIRDAAGRVIEESGFGEEKRYTLRDHSGCIVREQRGASRTEVTRDAMGRPSVLEHGDGTFQRFAWTKAGRLARAQEADRVLELARDGEGRVTLEKQGDVSVRSTYDASGHRTLLQTSLGLGVRFERDVTGALVSMAAEQHGHRLDLRFSRDACGREARRMLPGGVSVSWKRDAMGRATERTIELGDEVLGLNRYAWAGLDRLVRAEERGRPVSQHHHDARGRLVQVGGVIRALDAAGNVYRVRERDDHRYAAGGRLLEAYGIEYGYDEEGRRIEKKTLLGEGARYRWDPLGRLIEVALSPERRVAYDHDALGRRVARRLEQKTVFEGLDEPVWEPLSETRFIWDGLELLHEIEADDVVTWLWEGGHPIARISSAGAYAVITDPLGTPTEITDASGALVWRGSVDLFGTLHKQVERIVCPWRLPGHWEDADTGLAHAWLRVYDPDVGAYLSPSPLGVAGGPNAYAYLGDPCSETSPLGLGRGYAAFGGEVRSERLEAELVARFVDALDRHDGAAGPRARFDPSAARWTLPDPEAALWGRWERHRVARWMPPCAASSTRLPDATGLFDR